MKTPGHTDKLTYTIPEAAAALGVSRATLYDRIKKGELTTRRLYWRVVLRREDLQRVVASIFGDTPNMDHD